MSKLIYGGDPIEIGTGLELVDAVTQHLFRRGVSFTLVLSGTSAATGEPVSNSLWMSPQIPVQFLHEAFETVEISGGQFDEFVDRIAEERVYFCGPEGTKPVFEFVGADSTPTDE